MHILLYVPDNQVVRNFVPHLWPFVLKRLTPSHHKVTILDGNARPHSPEALAAYVREARVDAVGMGFMTRMAQAAYRTAQAIRDTGVPVVMGGPHVSAVPDEPLGRTGGPRYADAVAVGEADDLWPVIVRDLERGTLEPIYRALDGCGHEIKPSLDDYPIVPWDEIDLDDFNLMRFLPAWFRAGIARLGYPYRALYVVPVESGRGCPYGCEFCSVTGFFGGKPRFRAEANVIEELVRLKRRAARDRALVVVCFIDDNFALNRKRTKALLRAMIDHDVRFPWWGQVSVNLLGDDELVELMAASGARSLLLGLESVDPESLKAANKAFNKPAEYAEVLGRLSRNGIFAIPSFIFGLESDTRGVGGRTVDVIDDWPPSMPVFGVLTPYPGTPLYDRLLGEGRLTRPRHWLEFEAFRAAYTPRHLTADEVEDEVRSAWRRCYEPDAFARTETWLAARDRPVQQQLTHFVVRLFFRGIYFPQQSGRDWVALVARNAPTAVRIFVEWRRQRARTRDVCSVASAAALPEG